MHCLQTRRITLADPIPTEFPIPSLGGSGDIREICARYIRATNPTELAYTYEELKALDDIQVTLVPEKKGTLLKHNEYVVESRVSVETILIELVLISLSC